MFATIKGKKLHYEIIGQGRPILFVHGWGGTSRSIEPIARLLSDRFQGIVVDLPGFGQSDNPASSWGTKEYAEVIVELIKKLKLKKIVYFGHSFGGSLGIYLAASKPALIEHLILCSPSYKRERRTAPFARSLKNLFPRPIKLIIYRILFPNSDLARYPHLEANFRKIVTEDLSDIVGKIRTPTLILWGEDDTYTPVEHAFVLHERILGSKLKVFAGLRHNLPLLKPDLMSEAIINFL